MSYEDGEDHTPFQPTDIPEVKADPRPDIFEIVEEYANQVDTYSQRVNKILDIVETALEEDPFVVESQPKGELILHFTEVTSEEVGNILRGALKGTSKLTSMNYKMNNESETN